jgi:hypothetical protein
MSTAVKVCKWAESVQIYVVLLTDKIHDYEWNNLPFPCKKNGAVNIGKYKFTVAERCMTE